MTDAVPPSDEEPLSPTPRRGQKQHGQRHSKINFRVKRVVDRADLSALRHLNEQGLPVRYDDAYYAEMLNNPHFDCLLLFAPSQSFFEYPAIGPIAGVVCRKEYHRQKRKAYICTLVVREQFRRKGCATALMRALQQLVIKDPHVCAMYLHTQVNNRAAIALYLKCGFQITETLHNYYERHIVPRDCFVVEKDLKPIRRQLKKQRQQCKQPAKEQVHSPPPSRSSSSQASTSSLSTVPPLPQVTLSGSGQNGQPSITDTTATTTSASTRGIEPL